MKYRITLHGEALWTGEADCPADAMKRALKENENDPHALYLIAQGAAIRDWPVMPASNWERGIRNQEIANGSDD